MRNIIGRPWAVPCDPPRTFDCWELVRFVRWAQFSLETPTVVDRVQRRPSDRKHMSAPSEAWKQLDAPQIGCVARIGRNHVGVYLTGHKIIHAAIGAGVAVCQPWEFFGEEITYWELADA